MTRSDPSALRWLIGVELAAFRKRTGMTMVDASEATGIGKPKIGHIETGRYQQHPDDVAKLLKAYGAELHDVERLTSLTGRSNERTWWAPWASVVPDWFRTFVGLEGLAESEFGYESFGIPGLLQTDDYARALTEATDSVRRDHTERFVSFRLARARRLTDPEPLRVHTVMEESALLRHVGTPEVRRAQYEHLLHLCQQPNVTLQVVRPENGPHDAVTGPFVVLDFAHVRSVAYVEQLDGAIYVQDPDDVDTYKMTADSVQRVALPPNETLALVESLISER